jgi:hypothetical protein
MAAQVRTKRVLLSTHTSNPFDDPADPARRVPGFGSSELSECTSEDLGGFNDQTVQLNGDTVEDAEGVGYDENPVTIAPDEDMDEELLVFSDSGVAYQDEAMDDEDDALWSEEEFEEENSIYFRSPEERREIEAEIEDLQRAVPRLKEDYDIIDRLGTGTKFFILSRPFRSNQSSQVHSRPCIKLLTSGITIGTMPPGVDNILHSPQLIIKPWYMILRGSSSSQSSEYTSLACQSGFEMKYLS